MKLSRHISIAIRQLIDSGAIGVGPMFRVLDIGCGWNLCWVPEFYRDFRLDQYVGLDQGESISFNLRNCPSSDFMSDRFELWENVGSDASVLQNLEVWKRQCRASDLDVEVLSKRIFLHLGVNLTEIHLGEVLRDGLFELIIISDLLHCNDLKPSWKTTMEQVTELVNPGGYVLVRYFSSDCGFGEFGLEEVTQLDEIFGIPSVFTSENSPAHLTRLYRVD